MKMKRRILAFCMVVCILTNILPIAALATEELLPLAAATGISVNQTKNLEVGDSKPLILTAEPAGAVLPEVIWSSSDETVATVDEKGVVTGLKAGLVTITAAAKDKADMTASVDMVVRSVYPYSIGWSGSFTQKNNNQTTTATLPVEPSRVQKAWEAPVGNGTIAIVGDFIYTYDGTNTSGSTDQGGTFYKIDKNTGKIVDSLRCSASCGYYYSYTIYGGGLLYVGCVGSVMAFDPDSFTLLWTTETGSASEYPVMQFVNNCVLCNGVVLNSTTGEKVKTLEGTYSYSSGAEKDGLYYIASGNGTIYAFDTSSWEKLYELTYRKSSSSLQPGVVLNGNRLYWGEASGGKLYSVKLDDNGAFAKDSLLTMECDISTTCVPVIADGRMYLAGTKNEGGVVGVFRASDLSPVYTAEGGRGKIQSTPLVRIVDSDGPVVAGLNSTIPLAVSDGNYVFVQDYESPSKILLLQDNETTVSGSLNTLVSIEPADYAYEQLACDKDGALYATNDAGYLVKYVESAVCAPVLITDLSNTEVRYRQGAEALPLTITAEADDGGLLSYQWQSRTEDGAWTTVDGAAEAQYTPSTEVVGTRYYRCIVTNMLNGETASVTSREAKIVVIESTVCYGDVDENNTVNSKDVTILKRYIAKWPGVTLHPGNADVNGDGSVNSKDVTILKRYIAKWPGVMLGPEA